MATIKDLEIEFNRHNLTEYLKTLPTSEINQLLGTIVRNDIIGIRVPLYDGLLTELQYRKLTSVLKGASVENKIQMAVELYKEQLVKIKYNDIKESIEFYTSRNMDYTSLINWAPAGLDVKMCSTIYAFMKDKGVSGEEIKKMLMGDLESCIALYKRILSKTDAGEDPTKLLNDPRFAHLMEAIIEDTQAKKRDTESFDKLYEKLTNKNAVVIERLK